MFRETVLTKLSINHLGFQQCLFYKANDLDCSSRFLFFYSVPNYCLCLDLQLCLKIVLQHLWCPSPTSSNFHV